MHSEVMSDAAPSAEREFWVIEATLWQLWALSGESVALYGNLEVIVGTLCRIWGNWVTLFEFKIIEGCPEMFTSNFGAPAGR